MSDLPLIALGGLLASAHCVGMCGGFVVTIGVGSKSISQNLTRQLLYAFGRVFTYGFLGAVAGFGGFWFARRASFFVNAQAVLSIVAGVLLMTQGLLTLGILPRVWRGETHHACLMGSFVGPFLKSPQRQMVFLAGVLNGLLPCGLVYGYLALATSTANVLNGWLVMLAFGLGTIPAMVATGAGGSFVSHATRQRVFQVAAVFVFITGLLAFNRGLQFWNTGVSIRCPGCLAVPEFRAGG